MNHAIQQLSRKSTSELLQWKRTNPEYENIDSDFSNLCLVMQKESIAGYDRDKSYNKVFHKVCNNVSLKE